MAQLGLIETIETKLPTLGKEDGQLIVVRDNASLYFDLDGSRIYMSDWIDVSTDNDRLAMLSPLNNKYYYVIETNKIWRYIGGNWIEVTKFNISNLAYDNSESGLLADNLQDAIDELDENIDLIEATRNLQTYTHVSQIGLTDPPTIEEVMDALPSKSEIIFSVGAGSVLSNDTPLAGKPCEIRMSKTTTSGGGRGTVEVKRHNGSDIYSNHYYNGALIGWERHVLGNDLANYLPLSGGLTTGRIYNDGTKYAVAPTTTAYQNAPFVSQASVPNADATVRAGYGYHNQGSNAAFMYLDIDKKFKSMNNDGRTDTFAFTGDRVKLREAPTFASLADFWTDYDAQTIDSGQCAFYRFKDSTGWTPIANWWRCWVSSQNRLGNGQYSVSGTIILINTTDMYIGAVTGGATDTSNLAVTWKKVNNENEINNKLDVISTYYAQSTNQSADDLLDPHALIPISSTVNASLYSILFGSFAYVITLFYNSISTTSRRIQIAVSYNAIPARMAVRNYGANGWTDWQSIASTADLDSYLPLSGGTLTGVLNAANIIPTKANTYSIGGKTLPYAHIYSYANWLYNNSVTYGSHRITTKGTTDTVGETYMMVGNNLASGTADNSKGIIRIYGTGTGYTNIIAGNNATGNISITLPASGGTLALTSQLSNYLPLAGGKAMTGILSIQPTTGNTEGGEIRLQAPNTDAGKAYNSICLDQNAGKFRIFGIASADGKITGAGTVLAIDPYAKTITGGYTFTGALNGNASSATTLTGLTATVAELNYCNGVTSAIQTQLNAKAASSHTHNYLPLTGGVITKILGVDNTAYANAHIQLNSPTNTSSASRAGIGFHNAGTNGSCIWYDIDGMFKHTRNDGNTYTIIDTSNYTTYCAQKSHNHSGYAKASLSGTTLTITIV